MSGEIVLEDGRFATVYRLTTSDVITMLSDTSEGTPAVPVCKDRGLLERLLLLDGEPASSDAIDGLLWTDFQALCKLIK